MLNPFKIKKMKKILLSLLFLYSISSFAQAEFPEGIQLSGNASTVNSTKLINQNPTTGTLDHINATSLPISTAAANALDLRVENSAGAIEGFAITDNGNGTVNIATGTAYLRTTNDPYAPLIKYVIPAVTNLALTDNANNFVLVDYNSGTPALTVSVSPGTVNTMTNSIAYVISRVGTTLDYVSLIGQNVDANGKLRRRFLNSEGLKRASGAVLSGLNRNLILTSGLYYSGLIEVPTPAFNTSTGATFTQAYVNGGSWTRTTGNTQINNTQYSLAGVLTTMPSNDYRVDYVYILADNPSKMYVLLGNTTYNNIGSARLAPVPSDLPSELQFLGTRVGRIIIQKDAITMEVSSEFATIYQAGSAQLHNDLGGLNLGEFQHLTVAEKANNELKTNKQNSLLVDGTGIKYPTVDAVNKVVSFVTPEQFGAIGNGVQDDSAALQSAFTHIATNNYTLYLKGVYNIGSSAINVTGAGLKIVGSAGSKIIGTNDILLWNSGELIDVKFENVTLQSTGVLAGSYGLFASQDKKIDGLYFTNCNFTAPTSSTNAIKIINESVLTANNISFDNCKFKDIGRMAIEFQNHVVDGVSRYSNISVKNSLFHNTGSVSVYGMAVSFSGIGSNLSVTNNKIQQAKDIAVELVTGIKNVVVDGNLINNLKTGCFPISFSGVSPYYHSKVIVSNNVTDSDANINLYYLKNSSISNNKFYFTSGFLNCRNIDDNLINGNTIETTSNYSIYIESVSGLTSTRNTIISNELSNRLSSSNFSVIRFYGSATTFNSVFNNNIRKGTGGVYKDDASSAANNAYRLNYQEGIYETESLFHNGNTLGSNVVVGAKDNFGVDFLANNTVKAKLGTNGYFASAGINELASANNSRLALQTVGATIDRNIADGNTTLIVSTNNASATGRILDFKFNGSLIGYMNYDGNFNSKSYTLSVVPTTSAGTYEFLTRNTSNGVVEKVLSSSLATSSALTVGLATKQNTLVSGTNIKTINGNSILGSGDLVVGGGVAPDLQTVLDAGSTFSYDGGTSSGGISTGAVDNRQTYFENGDGSNIGSMGLDKSIFQASNIFGGIYGVVEILEGRIKLAEDGTEVLFNPSTVNTTLKFPANSTAGTYTIDTTAETIFTVATLPTGTLNQRAIVSDALTPTFLGALVGGGSVVCPVWHNGTAWVSR